MANLTTGLTLTNTTEPLRTGYDATVYVSHVVTSSGRYQLKTAAGGLMLDVPTALGSALQVLRVNSAGTGLEWGAVGGVGARATRTTNQSIPNSTATSVIFNAPDMFDTEGWHDPAGVNPERITVDRAGKYLVVGRAVWGISATGVRATNLAHNGTNVGSDRRNSAGTTDTSVSLIYPAVATDYFSMVVFQDSGGALNLLAAELAVIYLGG